MGDLIPDYTHRRPGIRAICDVRKAREFNPGPNLYFNRARFYDPVPGCFLSEDPLGHGGGDWNLYSLAWNNPKNWTDPSGMNAATKTAGFAAVALIAAPAYRAVGCKLSSLFFSLALDLTVVWGPPNCGQSFFVFGLAMHIALGWDYRGLRVKGGPVVYAALERAEGFKKRVEAFRREKLPDPRMAAPFHLISSRLSLVADYRALRDGALCRRDSPSRSGESMEVKGAMARRLFRFEPHRTPRAMARRDLAKALRTRERRRSAVHANAARRCDCVVGSASRLHRARRAHRVPARSEKSAS